MGWFWPSFQHDGTMWSWPLFQYNVTVVIPFAAVSAAVLIGFLLLPMLRKMYVAKRGIISSVIAVCIFFALSLYAEMISARLDVIFIVMTSRMRRSVEGIAALADYMTIPWTVRLHYYIFSIVLILALLNFLYGLADALYRGEKLSKKAIALQGGAVACYALAYFFVRAMQFKDYDTLLLTSSSVLNAAVCFILAGIAVGLYSGSFSKFAGLGKFISSILSSATVVALYAAEYAMLQGNLYSYHDSAAVTILLRAIIIAIPGVVVYFLFHGKMLLRHQP